MRESTRPHFVTASMRDGDHARVEVSGEVDMATAGELVNVVADAAGRTTKDVVLDLTRVTFLDSAGIHAIVRVADAHPGRVAVLPSAPVQRVLDLTGLGDATWVRAAAT